MSSIAVADPSQLMHARIYADAEKYIHICVLMYKCVRVHIYVYIFMYTYIYIWGRDRERDTHTQKECTAICICHEALVAGAAAGARCAARPTRPGAKGVSSRVYFEKIGAGK